MRRPTATTVLMEPTNVIYIRTTACETRARHTNATTVEKVRRLRRNDQ
jgi:hypothetical protein